MIGFIVGEKIFYTTVVASIPKVSVEAAESVQFPPSPSKEVATQTFILKNNGEIDFEYEWKVDTPFSIVPQKGAISVGKIVTFTVSFLPQVCSCVKFYV